MNYIAGEFKMVKPNQEYLEQAKRANDERKQKFRNRLLGSVLVGGATVAMALGLGGTDQAEGQEHFVPIKDPTATPKPQPTVENDERTAQFAYPDGDSFEQTMQESAELSDRAVELLEQIGYRESAEFNYEKPDRLKEEDIPQYTITGVSPQYDDEVGVVHDGGLRPVSPQLDPQDSDNGVVHGGKGIRTWQNDDDMSATGVSKSSAGNDLAALKTHIKQDANKQAQVDMALQLMKNIHNQNKV